MSKMRREQVGPSAGQRSGGTDKAASGAEVTRLSLGRTSRDGGVPVGPGMEGFRWSGRRQDLLMTGPGVGEKARRSRQGHPGLRLEPLGGW